jgi:hypothetical protein
MNLKDTRTKGDLGKNGTSEDGTGFSLIREVKMMMMNYEMTLFLVQFKMKVCLGTEHDLLA